ncbi:unnamed protein product [Periconia digitata]|uniref:WW domain-containing protein n=1 Tax=Periconia digitata TaxID=1303443 RepID=A0A9W4XF66_9PLEO|nr:unnamed protein product [Periconia digitata]
MSAKPSEDRDTRDRVLQRAPDTAAPPDNEQHEQSEEDGEIEESERSDSPPLPVIKTTTGDRWNAIPATSGPALPYDDEHPPLPAEAPPNDDDGDGWEYQYDDVSGQYSFYNKFTGQHQWENPRVAKATPNYGSYDRYVNSSPAAATLGAPGTSPPPKRPVAGGYNPAIHGNYDPNADYAKEYERETEEAAAAAANPYAAIYGVAPPGNQEYATTAHFNRFNGRFQQAGVDPEYHNDENKSKRQMNAYFDVDSAANSHEGRSLKAERRNQHLNKKDLKMFQDRRREKKEQKRRALFLN